VRCAKSRLSRSLPKKPCPIAALRLHVRESSSQFTRNIFILTAVTLTAKRMKRICLLALSLIATAVVHAQREEGHSTAPPPENLTFLTDEYVHTPKCTFSFGMRSLSGSKTSFSGRGQILPSSDTIYIGGLTGTSEDRSYHDGTVLVDARTITIDDGNGGTIAVPATPDGKTNTWSFLGTDQVTPDGNIAMHMYSADLADTGVRSKNGSNSIGIEMQVARDMGKLGTRFDWSLVGGMSLNDIRSKLRSSVPATMTTTTDIYSLFGASVPTSLPYTAPSSAEQNVVDASGNTVLNDDGSTRTETVDTTTLLGNEPLSRSVTSSAEEARVMNTWKVKGAYYTFRAGPTVSMSLTPSFRATVSAGVSLVYSGSTYTVIQELTPPTGDTITSTVSSSQNHFLPGYYADANVEWWLSETAGFYAGAVYQNNGNFTQTVKTDTADYSTKVDLSSLAGLRAGLNIRF